MEANGYTLTYRQPVAVGLPLCFPEPDVREPHAFKVLLHCRDWVDIAASTIYLFVARAVRNRILLVRPSGYQYTDKDVAKSIEGAVRVFEDGGGSHLIFMSTSQDLDTEGLLKVLLRPTATGYPPPWVPERDPDLKP